LDEWLAEFLWQKYVNGKPVDVLVEWKILWQKFCLIINRYKYRYR
jgi:hypothetical protein